MRDDFDIPLYLDRRLSPEERAAAAGIIAPQTTPVRQPTPDELAAAAWDAAYQRGCQRDREVIAELTEQEQHRAAVREALRAPAKLAFFEKVAAEREAERAVKAAAAETAAKMQQEFKRRRPRAKRSK